MIKKSAAWKSNTSVLSPTPEPGDGDGDGGVSVSGSGSAGRESLRHALTCLLLSQGDATLIIQLKTRKSQEPENPIKKLNQDK